MPELGTFIKTRVDCPEPCVDGWITPEGETPYICRVCLGRGWIEVEEPLEDAIAALSEQAP